MKLLSNNVLIERIPSPVSSIIHTPDNFQLEVENKGRVLATGPGKLTKRGARIPCFVQPGDVVTYYELAECHKTRISNQVVVAEDSIFCVLEQDPNFQRFDFQNSKTGTP